jgi:23S rRNA (uracil1939-C5)-methyltransferase
LRYEDTLYWKEVWTQDALRRIGGIEARVLPVLGMAEPWAYRNKTVLHEAGGRFGYYASASHEVVEFASCPLLLDGLNQALARLRAADAPPSALTGSRARALTLRQNRTGNVQCTVYSVQSGNKDAGNRETGHKEAGNGENGTYLTEEILGLKYQVSPASFQQVNPAQAEVLYRQVLDWADLTGRETVWDLYAGAGALTLLLASRCGLALGVEENPNAVKDAERNAARNGLTNARFYAGRCEEVLRGWSDGQTRSGQGTLPTPELVVLDPPRAGLTPTVAAALLQAAPQRLIYISCDPATLARDLGRLVHGYAGQAGRFRLEAVQPVDMFCWCADVECVCLLAKL